MIKNKDLIFYDFKIKKDQTLTKYLVKIASLNPIERSVI